VVVIVGGRIMGEDKPGGAGDLEARFAELVGKAQLQ
jgi:hypothetical protein